MGADGQVREPVVVDVSDAAAVEPGVGTKRGFVEHVPSRTVERVQIELRRETARSTEDEVGLFIRVSA